MHSMPQYGMPGMPGMPRGMPGMPAPQRPPGMPMGVSPLTPFGYRKAMNAMPLPDPADNILSKEEMEQADRRAKYKSVFANPYESMVGRGI
jgi:hypothetical protein